MRSIDGVRLHRARWNNLAARKNPARRVIKAGCNLDANYRHRSNQSRNARITIREHVVCAIPPTIS